MRITFVNVGVPPTGVTVSWKVVSTKALPASVARIVIVPVPVVPLNVNVA